MENLKSFIDKNVFKTLSGCIFIVELLTQSLKQLFPNVEGVWIAFIFSCLVALVRLLFNDKYTRDDIILSIINIVPIFLGSVGIYETAVKPIINLIS